MKKIAVFLLTIIFFSNLNTAFAENFKSVHQLQSEENSQLTPLPLETEKIYSKKPKGELTPRVNKQVMGYYTYWKTGTSNIQWDLLTILAYFSAELDSSGNITDLNGWPSSAPINEAHYHGVKVVLTATLFGSDSIRTLIRDASNRSRCIQNLFSAVEQAQADGICIDFELPYSTDREYFNTFIQELADYFHSNMEGSLVIVDTPAVNWSDRMDFDTLTDYADYLFIMAYDYHYSGGDPGPVSPLSYTDGSPWPTWAGIVQTLDDYINGTYGVGNGKKNKLILGVPYYGYDWPSTNCEIPTTQRANASAVIYSTAVLKAEDYNREWDNFSQTPFYDYNCYTSYPHQAWYDDEVSLGLKYDKVNQYDIGGTGMWALNYDGTRPELWDKLREKFGFFIISATSYGNGTISPSGNVKVDYNSSIQFTFTPDIHNEIDRVVIDGNDMGAISSYTFENVKQDHYLEVYFREIPSYTIEAIASSGGTISPSGTIMVYRGDNVSFIITPDNGFFIKQVIVDGQNVGALNTYTFSNIIANHTIEAVFEKETVQTFTITASATEGGTIYPQGEITVYQGQDLTFTITPDSGYLIHKVEIDGADIGTPDSYTFENIQDNHSIKAYFLKVEAPKLISFNVSPQTGFVPLNVNLSAEFSDAGNTITRYRWIIKGDAENEFETENPDISIEFRKAGKYYISVEAENSAGLKTGSGFKAVYPIQITTRASSLDGEIQTERHSFNSRIALLNPFNQPINIAVKSIDLEGNQKVKNISLEPYSKIYLNTLFEKNDTLQGYLLTPGGEVVIYTEVQGESLAASAYQTKPFSYLTIPHIPEEKDYWETLLSVSTKSSDSVEIVSGENSLQTESNYFHFENITELSNTDAYGWGKVNCESGNLSGFELFIQNNSDGAAVSLKSEGSKTLIIPHIPEEKEIFWTGFTFTNTENKEGSLLITLYDNDGNTVGTKTITINPYQKLKGLFKDFFAEEEFQNAVWGEIVSTVEICGIELYGVSGGAICGFELPDSPGYTQILPMVYSDENSWTGLAVVNPQNKACEITVKLYDGKGQLLESRNYSLTPYSRFKDTLSNIFPNIVKNENNFIVISSNNPMVAIEVSGDRDRKFMKSLIGY